VNGFRLILAGIGVAAALSLPLARAGAQSAIAAAVTKPVSLPDIAIGSPRPSPNTPR
jgi:hypothetical protein